MNDTGTIELTTEERPLVDAIDFNTNFGDREAVLPMLAAASKLTPLLLARGAIPQRRLQCFVEPGWSAGRKSWQQVFEGNGTSGEEIFSHGNFLRFLRFFVHGANVPVEVRNAMRDQIGNPQWFSGGDCELLRKLARQLARQYGLDSRHAEEFMHLCADLGLSSDHADSVRRTILTVKLR